MFSTAEVTPIVTNILNGNRIMQINYLRIQAGT